MFSDDEKQHLLQAKFVGEKVISRLEEMGIGSLEKLAAMPVDTILEQGATITASSCWKNSPNAKQAITNAIEQAKNYNH